MAEGSYENIFYDVFDEFQSFIECFDFVVDHFKHHGALHSFIWVKVCFWYLYSFVVVWLFVGDCWVFAVFGFS